MITRTIQYEPDNEEFARGGWYLSHRDHFLAKLVSQEAKQRGFTRPQILDAGCATGGLTTLLHASGFDVTSIDADLPSLEWGSKMGRITRPVHANVSNMPFLNREFDICVASEVLEHCNNDTEALEELLRVCRGRLIITVPAHMYLWSDSDDTLLHVRRYDRKHLLKLVESCGGTVTELHPYGIIPAIFVMGYKLITCFSKNKKIKPKLPLASRYSVPKPVDLFLGLLFRLDLYLSRIGVMPWGHGWWMILKK